MFNIGPTELIVIVVIALIVFGPKRLPEMGRSVGKSLQEFRRATAEVRREIRDGLDAPSVPEPAAEPAARSVGSPDDPGIGL